MDTLIVESYSTRVRELSCFIDRETGALQELLRLIECNKDKVQGDRDQEEFFKGEYAFYSGNYQRALKHYLEAKSIPNFEFFCYRVSAYILKGELSIDKAIGFIRRALEIFPDDYPSLTILNELLTLSGHSHEAFDVIGKAKKIAGQFSPSEKNYVDKSLEHAKQINLGKKEIEELAGIFSVHPSTESLFCSKKETENSKVTFPTFEEIDPSISFYSRMMARYLANWKNRGEILDHTLRIFDGWERPGFDEGHDFSLSMLYAGNNRSSGGIYLRWQGKGIVINPGKNFLNRFHRAGLYIQDIDFVIVTDEDGHAYADLEKIYDLRDRINQEIKGGNKIIHYYLNQRVYQKLFGVLKPRSKQERYAIHKLELFVDSFEGEEVELNKEVRLHYNSSRLDQSLDEEVTPSMDIRLELLSSEPEGKSINIGYFSATPKVFSPPPYLTPADLLILRIRENDQLNKHLIDADLAAEESLPKLILCTEFNAFNGDTRLETIKAMRKKISYEEHTAILPADSGLVVDLKKIKIQCCFTSKMVEPDAIRVIRKNGPFSSLCYLSKESYL